MQHKNFGVIGSFCLIIPKSIELNRLSYITHSIFLYLDIKHTYRWYYINSCDNAIL